MTESQPILSGFYPDPSICRVGHAYYLVNSTFEYLPGVPVHVSTDLVTWTLVGNALTRPSQIAEHDGYPSAGVYAPTIRYYDGRFWIIGTDVNGIPQGQGHFLIHAADAAGPWSDPVYITGPIGIDPDIAWDDSGTAHVTWCSLGGDLPGIISAPVDTVTGRLLAPPRQLWQGTGLAAPEGPHLYFIDGWWYLLLAEGGTERGHAVTMARARTLDGPFEAAPRNPILSHRSLAHPVQNTGHADLFQLSDGTWAAVHLGVRPRGQSPSFHVNGRESFLVGVEWVEGWPVIDETRFAVPATDHSFHDTFSGSELHPRWLGVGRFPASFTRMALDGGVTIDAGRGSGAAMLAVRTTDAVWSASARFDPVGGSGRLLLRIDDAHWYGLTYDGTTVEATVAIGPVEHTVGRWDSSSGDVVTLLVRANPPRPMPHGISREPDLIELAAIVDGVEHSFGEFDGRYLSTEVAGGFTGRVVGVQALSGQVLLHDVDYRTRHSPETTA